ncbi:hypothetical protein [Tolumonas lignilytica]|jgi:hypothetical protein|uniref:hypothetical protein n=1 Tax=Tolumonas lignilytica TaxID=1283284 RepID=UPI0004670021|nr:hypothetical protein [Tolumonas lignilytica]
MMWRILPVIACVLIAGCSSQSGTQSNVSPNVTPSNTALFLRGDMTDWDARSEYQVQQTSSNVFSVKAELHEAGKTYHFKFADARWLPAMNYGAAMDDAELSLDTPVPVRAYSCLDELSFTPELAGKYEFVLDLRNRRAVALVKLVQ